MKESMYLPLWTYGLTPELVRIAEKELGETPEVRAQALKELRRQLKEIPDLVSRTDDGFLLRFLRAKKYDMKKALDTVRNYYYFKARYSGVLTDFTPSDVEVVFNQKACCLTCLACRNTDYSSVGIFRPAYFDLDEVTPEMVFASALVSTEILLELEPTQVRGYAMIFDLKKMGFRTLRAFGTPTFVYRLVRLIQDCVPCRIKGLHIVNEPACFTFFFNMAKPFLSEKMAKRVHFHGSDMRSLHKHIPREILPEELGGCTGPMCNRDMVPHITSREAHFEKVNRFGFIGRTAQDVKRKNSRSLFE